MFWDQYVIYYNFNLYCKTFCHVTTENCQNIWEFVLSNMEPEVIRSPSLTVTSSLAGMLY